MRSAKAGEIRAIYSGMFDTGKERASNGNRGALRKLRHHEKSRHTRTYIENEVKFQSAIIFQTDHRKLITEPV